MIDQLPKPTAFTPEAQAVIVDAVARGNYLVTACQRAGVTYSAFAYWRKLVEKRHPNAEPFVDFFEAIKKALSAAEINALDSLKAGSPGWQAQAWFLERRFPKRWAVQAPGAKAEDAAGKDVAKAVQDAFSEADTDP